MESIYYWIGFGIFVLILLALDLLVFNKKAHEVKLKEALAWSAVWIALALLFGVFVHIMLGPELALQYYAAYVMEKSLSMDNIFVFMMIFTYFRIPPEYQHRVLFWGIIGALVMRLLFIFLGITLINQFHWVLYVFGIILIYSAVKMIKDKDKEIHPESNPVIKLFRKIMPVTTELDDGKFFTRKNSTLMATPFFIVLLVIESSDIMFAVDSIPAVIAISKDTFVVYTSNIMAILGLRALYFAISYVMRYFRYLNYGLAVILSFVGLKMLLSDMVHIPIGASLAFIAVTLAVSIVASVVIKNNTSESEA